MKKLLFVLISSAVILVADGLISAGENSLLITDTNSSLYWKGSYRISYNEDNITMQPQKVLQKINRFIARNNLFFAIDNNGVLYAMGSYSNGVLGNGKEYGVVRSFEKIPFDKPVKYVESDGANHTLIIDRDGLVYAVGENLYGELGIENINPYSSLVKFMQIPNLKDIVSVKCGVFFSLALDSYGNVYSWGNNYHGELGLGDNEQRDTPQKIKSLKNVIQIETSLFSAYALDKNGDVYAWGYGSDGELGNSNDSNSNIPQKIDGLSNIVMISASSRYAMALDKYGNVYTWGCGCDGNIGDGKKENRYTPYKLSLSRIKDIAAGDYTSFALSEDDTLYGWGKNDNALVKDSNDSVILEPTKVNLPIEAKTDFTELKPDKEYLSLKKGWNFVGLPVGMSINISSKFNRYLIFQYRAGSWQVASDIYSIRGFKHFNRLDKGYGFWVESDRDQNISFDRFDYDLNTTVAEMGSNGWSMLSAPKDGEVIPMLRDGFRADEDRKIVWKYNDAEWCYFTKDQNISNLLKDHSDIKSFDGFIKKGEGFWVYTDSYLYDYRNIGGFELVSDLNRTKFLLQNEKLNLISVNDEHIVNMDGLNICNGSGRGFSMSEDGAITIYNCSNKYNHHIDIISNANNKLKQLSKFEADGYIWSVKIFGNRAYLDLGNSLEIVDISDFSNPKFVKSIPCYSGYFITKGDYTITSSKDGDDVYLNIFDKEYNLLKKIHAVKGDSISMNKIFSIDGNTVFASFYGYKNSSDQSSYLSGFLTTSLDSNLSDRNISFEDTSMIPFDCYDGKIFATFHDSQYGGLRIFDKNFKQLYSYDFSSFIYSFTAVKRLGDSLIVTITERNGGQYLSIFDSELNLKGEVNLGSDYYENGKITRIGNGDLIIYPDGSGVTMFKISLDSDYKPHIISKKSLKRGYNSFTFDTNNDIMYNLSGQKGNEIFQIVNLDRFF